LRNQIEGACPLSETAPSKMWLSTQYPISALNQNQQVSCHSIFGVAASMHCYPWHG
jgi:hypothetical protein